MKKRYIGLFLCLALTAGAVMGGCSSSGETENTTEETAAENDTEESAGAEEQTAVKKVLTMTPSCLPSRK